MPRSATCPRCQFVIPLPEGFTGREINCPRCAELRAARRAEEAAANSTEAIPPTPAEPESQELPELELPEPADQEAESETYSLNLPVAVSSPRKKKRSRSEEDDVDDDDSQSSQRTKSASRKRKPRSRSIFAQASWISTVVGSFLIGLVLSFGVGYAQRERDRPLPEFGQPETTTTQVPTNAAPAEPAPTASTSSPSGAAAQTTPAPSTTVAKSNSTIIPAASSPDLGMFQHKSTLKLPSPTWDLAFGGAGQFVAVFCADQRRLEVIDVEQAQTAFTVPMANDLSRFALGRSKLFVFHSDKDRKVIERWNLRTKEREVERPNPHADFLSGLALGADSEGPLLVWMSDNSGGGPPPGWYFLDPESFDIERVRATNKTNIQTFSTKQRLQVRAAADGSLFSAWRDGASPSGLAVLTMKDGQAELSQVPLDVGFAAPSFDGQFLSTERGLFRQPFNFDSPANEFRALCFPALDSHFYLTKPRSVWQLRATGIEAILGELPHLVMPRVASARDRQINQRVFDRRLTFVSKLGRLVYLSQNNDSLVFYDTDVKRLPSLTAPKLAVTSRPPPSIRQGQSFVYQIETIGSSRQLEYQLDFAPAGLTIASNGKVTWDVPSDYAEPDATIVLTVRSTDGADEVHAFVLQVLTSP